MCGFFLAVNDPHVDVRRYTAAIRHRGTDSVRHYVGEGIACGFNRLAIVDQDPASDQPMLDAQARFLLVFNGEIYNHVELRAALERSHGVEFTTRSDTEVVLEGLKCIGPGFLSALDGIFALAFVDLESRDVLLARDQFGVKPVYYACDGDRFYACSEIGPLRMVRASALDLAGMARYLAYGVVGDGGSIARDVHELDPNTYRIFDRGREARAGTIQDGVNDTQAVGEVDAIGALLDATIVSQRPAIPYGVLFSGGLDSTLVLARCHKDPNFQGAYSVDVEHPDMSERCWQEEAVEHLGIGDRYRPIALSRTDFSLENIAKVVQGLDYPLFHPNFIGSYLLARMARADGLKVLISGEGADEVFLGYRWFFTEQPVSDFLEYVPLQAVARILGAGEPAPVRTDGMTLLELFQKVYLRRWLLRQDLTGMANTVEVRVPFLGLELVRGMNRLSMAFKAGGAEGKWIIKRLLAGEFSSRFIQRRKVGFDFPLTGWMGAEHLDYLRGRARLFDRATLDDILDGLEGHHSRGRLIFSLVSFTLWYEGLGSGA